MTHKQFLISQNYKMHARQQYSHLCMSGMIRFSSIYYNLPRPRPNFSHTQCNEQMDA